MHLTEGILRAYIDDELREGERIRAEEHLGVCSRCQAEMETLSKRVVLMNQHFELLTPDFNEARLKAGAARARLEARIAEKESSHMFQKILSRVQRPAWAALGVILILGIAMLFPGVRAAANSFLGLFRVEQFTIVQFETQGLEDELGSSSHFEYLISENVQVEEVGQKGQVEDASQASDLAGIPVRLPQSMDAAPALSVESGASITFDVDLPRINALLQEIGRGDLELPGELDGATVGLDIPMAVVAQYGDCQDPAEAAPAYGNCPRLIQVPSPTISAPEGLDVAAIGEAFLQVLGMSPQEAASFSENVDWSTTLILPLPRQGTSYQDVNVDGVKGNLIEYRGYHDGQQMRLNMVIWVKDGIVYALSGVENGTEIVEIANSLP